VSWRPLAGLALLVLPFATGADGCGQSDQQAWLDRVKPALSEPLRRAVEGADAPADNGGAPMAVTAEDGEPPVEISRFTCEALPPDHPAGAEQEPNGTRLSANPVLVGSDVHGEVTGGDQADFLRFTAMAGEDILITARSPDGSLVAPTALQILGPDGTTVLAHAVQTDVLELLSPVEVGFRAPEDAEYFLRVENFPEFFTGPYVIELRRCVVREPVLDAPPNVRVHDPTGDPAGAAQNAPALAFLDGAIFSFFENRGILDGAVSLDGGAGFTPFRPPVLGTGDRWTGNVDVATCGDTFYVTATLVTGDADPEPATGEVREDDPDGTGDDTLATAIPMVAGDDLRGGLAFFPGVLEDTVDVASFPAVAGQELLVSVEAWGAGGLTFSILGPDGSVQIAEETVPLSSVEERRSLRFTAAADGLHYVVLEKTGEAAASYTLEARRLAAPAVTPGSTGIGVFRGGRGDGFFFIDPPTVLATGNPPGPPFDLLDHSAGACDVLDPDVIAAVFDRFTPPTLGRVDFFFSDDGGKTWTGGNVAPGSTTEIRGYPLLGLGADGTPHLGYMSGVFGTSFAGPRIVTGKASPGGTDFLFQGSIGFEEAPRQPFGIDASPRPPKASMALDRASGAAYIWLENWGNDYDLRLLRSFDMQSWLEQDPPPGSADTAEDETTPDLEVTEDGLLGVFSNTPLRVPANEIRRDLLLYRETPEAGEGLQKLNDAPTLPNQIQSDADPALEKRKDVERRGDKVSSCFSEGSRGDPDVSCVVIDLDAAQLRVDTVVLDAGANANFNLVAEPGEDVRLFPLIENRGHRLAERTFRMLASTLHPDLFLGDEQPQYSSEASEQRGVPVLADGWVSASIDPAAACGDRLEIDWELGGQVARTFIVLGQPEEAFADDFEGPILNDWTTSGLVERVQLERAVDTFSYYFGDKGGFGPDDNSYPPNAEMVLTSPPLDLTDLDDAILSYHVLADTQGAGDVGVVEASSDGFTNEVVIVGVIPSTTSQSFVPVEHDLAAFTGSDGVQLRWRFTSGASPDGAGLYVDDVEVRGRVCGRPGNFDGDAHDNHADNCPCDANDDQTDSNGDGFGDVCDQDVDDDGITGIPDVNQWRLHVGTSDPVYDWNLDGVVDTADVAELDLGTLPGPPSQSSDAEEVWSQALSGQPVEPGQVGAPPRPIFLLQPAGLRGSCRLQLDR
jgi:hypothetical protein